MTNGAIDLYHDLEGGPIADQRPPPPGVDSPYPNIGTTPARPLAADVGAQQRIGDSLAAQRDAATMAAAQDPLKVIPPPPAPPPPTSKPAVADPNANRVVVDAAPTPVVPPAPPPKPAPVPAVADPDAGPGIGSVPAIPTPVASSAPPDFADGPPPGPTGLELVKSLPPPTPPVVVAPPMPLPNGVTVAFTPGSSTLPPSATLILRRFVMAHRGAAIVVTGRGDGGPRTADAQSGAIELALKRASAIAVSLGGAGVAPGNVHLRADAIGTASTATLN